MADKFKRYGVPVRLENTPIFKKLFADIEKLLDEKVAKRTSTSGSTVKYVYGYDTSGDISIIVGQTAATGNSLVQRSGTGRIVCADPNADNQAATKKYVDDAIATLKAELTQ